MKNQSSAAAHSILDGSGTTSVILVEHRRALAHNQEAYTYEVVHNSERLIRTLIPHIKGSGVSVSPRKHGPSQARAIALLFETQDSDRSFTSKVPNFRCVGTGHLIGIKLISSMSGSPKIKESESLR